MTDQEVIGVLRAKMIGIDHMLLADPPATEKQVTAAMAEMTKELLVMLSPPPRRGVAEDVPAPAAPAVQAETTGVSRQKS